MSITSTTTLPAPPTWAIERALSELGISDDIEAGRLMARAAEIAAASQPAPPAASWATAAKVHQDERGDGVHVFEASRVLLPEGDGLPEVRLTRSWEYVDGQWFPEAAEIYLTQGTKEVTIARHQDEARTVVAALAQGADLLAQILGSTR